MKIELCGDTAEGSPEIVRGDARDMLRCLKSLGSSTQEKRNWPLRLTVIGSNYDQYLEDLSH